MTSFSHNPNNHLSRRASMTATAPYTIPSKSNHSSSHHNTPFSPPSSHSNVHIPQRQTHTNGQTTTSGTQQPLSSSVPVLSREFVVRRISEGESGRLKEELKCEACGKGYKHISSLAKHLWEHTPEWNVTKKLLISKHQQVQLLEAASILVSMNEVSPSPKTNKQKFPTINEEVKFNRKYRENSPTPISEQPDESDDVNIKLRTGSISQYPPSHIGLQGSSPAKFHNNGGFLDTPSKLNTSTSASGEDSESHTPSSDLNNENAIIDDEEEEEPTRRNGQDDEDVGVFGNMD